MNSPFSGFCFPITILGVINRTWAYVDEQIKIKAEQERLAEEKRKAEEEKKKNTSGSRRKFGSKEEEKKLKQKKF